MQEDSQENRDKVSKLWWWVTIYIAVMTCILFTVLIFLPIDELHEEVEELYGVKIEKLDEQKKMEIRYTFMFLVALIGTIFTWALYYVHKKSKIWSK